MANIEVTGSITILRDSQTVFDFIANLENDKFWRREITSTTMAGKPQIDALATEHSFLSKRVPDHVLDLVCTVYHENSEVVYHTVPGAAFYLKSTRQVKPVAQDQTRVDYSIAFDKRVVKHGLGFNLPAFVVRLVAKADMKKYLANLKAVVEARNTPA